MLFSNGPDLNASGKLQLRRWLIEHHLIHGTAILPMVLLATLSHVVYSVPQPSQVVAARVNQSSLFAVLFHCDSAKTQWLKASSQPV